MKQEDYADGLKFLFAGHVAVDVPRSYFLDEGRY